jgi:hypothetical protein
MRIEYNKNTYKAKDDLRNYKYEKLWQIQMNEELDSFEKSIFDRKIECYSRALVHKQKLNIIPEIENY